MNITYILIPAAIFAVMGYLSYSLSLRIDRVRLISSEDKVYPVAAWFWVLTFIFAGMIVAFGLALTFQIPDGTGWIDASVACGFAFLFLIIPTLVFCARSYVEIKGDKVIYHNGFRIKEFSRSGVIACRLDSFFIVAIVHARNPRKPIRLSPCYKNSAELIAVIRAGNRWEPTDEQA